MGDKPVDFEWLTDGSTLKALRTSQRATMVFHRASEALSAGERAQFESNISKSEHFARMWHEIFGGILCQHGWFDPMQCDDCTLRAIDDGIVGQHDRCELLIREFQERSKGWDGKSGDLFDFVEEGGG